MPPGWAERLLRRRLGPDDQTEFMVGDLREEYAAQRALRGVVVASVWYVWQAGRLAARIGWERRRTEHVTAKRKLSGSDVMRTELKQAWRFLWRRPGFSAAIVLTIALAIAAATLVFAVVDGVLLRPLPYAEPDRLVAVWEHSIPRDNDRNVVSAANFLTWQEELSTVESLAVLFETSSTLLAGGVPERVGAVTASSTYFDIVGARPLTGRLYGAGDDAPEAESVVVLSEDYWRRRFGNDERVIGQQLTIGGAPRTVVGVLPARFDFDVAASFGGIGSRDVWVPAQFGPSARTASGRNFQVIGRLAPGVTAQQAQLEATSLAARLAEQFPARQTGWSINIVPLRDDLVNDVRRTLLIAFGAVGLVLLIACANVANLLLTRAAERHQEIAVRSALGAGPGRLVRQLLTESFVLAGIGALVGVALAFVGLRALLASAPAIPRIGGIGLDIRVAAFALGLTVLTAVLFGALPALHIARADAGSWLKSRGTAGRHGAQLVRSSLVVAQMALSLVLLIGAGLLVRSLMNRLDVGVGFDVEQLLTAEVQLPADPYDSPERQALLFEQLVEDVRALPGVEHASAVIFPPLTGPGTGTSIWPLDRPNPAPGESPTADIRWIERNYPGTIGIPVLEGRGFEASDVAGSQLVVLISEAGARELWPDESAVGKRIAMPWGDTLRAEVVGVVGDLRHSGPDVEPRTMIYWDHRQFRPFPQMSLLARTTGAPADVVPGIRDVLRRLDPQLPLYNVRSMRALFDDAVARPRFTTLTLAAFALIALILAVIGTYAVIAYATEQRSQEIGVRMALGASRSSVLRMVVSQGVALIMIALLVGAAGALALSRLLQSLLFDVATTDIATFAAMAALLAGAGVIACLLPARRASGIDPVSAMRAE